MGGGKSVPGIGPLEVGPAPVRRWIWGPAIGAGLPLVWAVVPGVGLAPPDVFSLCAYPLIALAGLRARARAKELGWLARIDESGITPHGGRTVVWAEVKAVARSKKYPGAVVFLPRPDAQRFPAMPQVEPHERRRARLIRRFGSPLVLFTTHLDADLDAVVAAVDRFSGGVPVL